MATKRRRGRLPARDRLVPAAYAVLPLLIVAFVLPSALRPPPDVTQSGAQYSPDAPPNAKAQTIIKTQEQPGSSTAGQEGASPTPTPTPPAPTPTPSSGPRASTVGCAPGNPPMQWDSVYSVPCEPAFIGNNGGATGQGVTANQINVVVSFYGQQQTDGIINDTSARSSDQLRTLNDIQKYLNAHAMLYNRKIQLYYATEGGATADETTQRSDTVQAISKYHPIAAMVEGTPPEIDEYTKAHVLSDQWLSMTEDYIQKEAPYAWAQNGPTISAQMASEWICKQVKGYPPIKTATTGLATYNPKAPRKFGAIEPDLAHFESGPTLLAGLKTCGVQPLDQTVGIDNASDIQQALLKAQREGVTSMILNIDLVDAMVIMAQAKSIGYYPEWITTGYGGFDEDAYLVRDVPSDEISNTFGLFLTEINRAPADNECYKAVASVDPGFTAHALYCHIYWEMISHLVSAIELTGPKLNAQRLTQTYRTLPALTPSPADNWADLGDYADPGRRTWTNAAGVYWWDPKRIDADGGTGTYDYADCAARFRPGQFPIHPAHIYTSSGFVTGRTFGSSCQPQGTAKSRAVPVTLTQPQPGLPASTTRTTRSSRRRRR